MRETIPCIILSIVETNNKEFILKRLDSIKEQLKLTEVELKIVKDIEALTSANAIPEKAYLEDKYSYYFSPDEMLFYEQLSKDAIGTAIASRRIEQEKFALAKKISELSSQATVLSSKDLKEQVRGLLDSSVFDSKVAAPSSELIKKENAYKDLLASGGMSWGIPGVEKYTGKISPGTVVSILGFVGSFKSTAALQVALMNALQGFNILYLALEDTSARVISRLVLNYNASKSKNKDKLIESTWIRDGKLAEVHQAHYNKTHNELITKLDNHLIVWDQTEFEYQTFSEMEDALRAADKQFKETTGHGLYAVVVDQISLLKYTKGSGKKQSYDGAVINDWVSFFYKQCLNFLDEARQIAVIIVSQVGREKFAEASKPKKKGRYEADCASDAHEIERAATSMVTLYKDMETGNTLLINVPKARQGFQPDNPLQVEVHGEYFYIGQLAAEDSMGISADIFKDKSTNDNRISIADLIDM